MPRHLKLPPIVARSAASMAAASRVFVRALRGNLSLASRHVSVHSFNTIVSNEVMCAQIRCRRDRWLPPRNMFAQNCYTKKQRESLASSPASGKKPLIRVLRPKSWPTRMFKLHCERIMLPRQMPDRFCQNTMRFPSMTEKS
jgi:hypothetical protein